MIFSDCIIGFFDDFLETWPRKSVYLVFAPPILKKTAILAADVKYYKAKSAFWQLGNKEGWTWFEKTDGSGIQSRY